VKRKQVIAEGGRNLFAYYNSMEHLLRSLYPTHAWEFGTSRARNGFWADITHQRQALDTIGKSLGIVQVLVAP